MAPGVPPASTSTPTPAARPPRCVPLVPPVVLLGPPGAGKTTVGARVAARLGFVFVDLDERVDVDTLRREGEAGFRVREFLALQAALDEGAVVIAAGAGIVDTGAARAALARACCVALDIDVERALTRIADGTRPWLPDRRHGEGARRQAWLQREHGRAPHRSALVDGRVVDAGGNDDDVVAAVVDAVGRWRSGRAPVAVASALGPLDGFVIADRAVATRLPRVDIVVDDARRKDAGRLFELLRALATAGVSRRDRIVAVGGGALLDVVGLAAGLHHRGTPWVAVPTTLLAMVDAGLGGKTAVDVELDAAAEADHGRRVRNAAGVIHHPDATVVWPGFLATLDSAQLRHGRAEMAKHALLVGDERALDGALDGALDRAVAGPLDEPSLAWSAGVKRFVVERDPAERHLRLALNLGHTFAHALESLLRLPHGDAVAHGLRCMLRVARAVGGLDDARVRTADDALARLGTPPLPALSDDDVDALLSAMRRDKKAHGGLRLVLLGGRDAPGPALLADVDDAVIVEVLRRP
jgi:shikimate kinase/3-dehydroquinate synthase